MGLFKGMKDMQQQAQDQMAGQQGMMQQAMGDQAAQAAYAQLAQKLNTAGVDAQGVIHSIAPGPPDMGGSQMTDVEVSIKPADGEPYQTTVKQSFLPAQLEELTEGKAITVKYDPDSPTSAMIFGW